MAFFLMQAGTGAALSSADIAENSYGITSISGAAGIFAYSQTGVTVGSITSSQSVVTNNGPDFNYVVAQVASLMTQVVGAWANLSAFRWCNDQKDRPAGSYLDVAYYQAMEVWSNGNVLAFFGPGNWFTQPGAQSPIHLPNQQGLTINGPLTLNVPAM